MTDIMNRNRELKGWLLRERIPQGDGPHPLILMLHGWTGDEDAMWVFASRLPSNAMLVAPRGLYPAPMGGFSWQPQMAKLWPWVDDFNPAVEALLELLTDENFPQADFSQLRLLGFSQGAALAFTFALTYPEQVRSFAGLSGFLPDGVQPLVNQLPLEGKNAFLAHGTQDQLVPVARARQAAQLLGQAGARVSYCEDDVGHKLSSSCFKGLKFFFARN